MRAALLFLSVPMVGLVRGLKRGKCDAHIVGICSRLKEIPCCRSDLESNVELDAACRCLLVELDALGAGKLDIAQRYGWRAYYANMPSGQLCHIDIVRNLIGRTLLHVSKIL